MILYLKHPYPVVIILCFITVLSKAQKQDTLRPATVQEKSEAIQFRMEKELGLSKEQSLKINKILVDRFEELAKSKSGLSLENANLKAFKELSTILNKDQYSLYEQLRNMKKQDKEEYLKDHSSFAFSKQDLEMDF